MSLVESWAVKGILANLVPSPPLLLKHCILVAFCLPVRVHARFPQPILGGSCLGSRFTQSYSCYTGSCLYRHVWLPTPSVLLAPGGETGAGRQEHR